MTQYVYLLSDHDEHGSENVVATLDRGRLLELLVKGWPWADKTEGRNLPENVKNESDILREYLAANTDADLADGAPRNLSYGWGGVQLHVVELV